MLFKVHTKNNSGYIVVVPLNTGEHPSKTSNIGRHPSKENTILIIRVIIICPKPSIGVVQGRQA